MIETIQQIIVCPNCQSEFNRSEKEYWVCRNCGFKVPLQNGIPIFSDVPKDIIPSEKVERGPGIGTHWRQANWKFIEDQIKLLPQQAFILDVGSGRGDFKAAFAEQNYIGLEILPYPEVDLVCDLNRCVPFKDNTFDMVALLNICEHVIDPKSLLRIIYRILKSGGVAVVAIPFMIKIHQAPYDFGRYTHFALEKMGRDVGFDVEKIEGFYDPAGLIDEALNYYRYWGLSKLSIVKRVMVGCLLSEISFHNKFIEMIGGRGSIQDPNKYYFPAPTGYHVVYRKMNRGTH